MHTSSNAARPRTVPTYTGHTSRARTAQPSSPRPRDYPAMPTSSFAALTVSGGANHNDPEDHHDDRNPEHAVPDPELHPRLDDPLKHEIAASSAYPGHMDCPVHDPGR